MGWLPIALALAGFMFFVIIVNFNTLKVHKEAIFLAYFNFCQTARARHTLLNALKITTGLIPPPAFEEENRTLKRFPLYRKQVKEELQSIEYTSNFFLSGIANSSEVSNKIKSLQVLNHRQQLNIKVFNRKVREYNKLVSSYPTKLVARITGFNHLLP